MLKTAFRSTLLLMAVASPAFGQANFPADVTDGFYITLEEIRANSAAVFETFAGPGGGPISQEQFVSTELPQDIVPGESDRALLERLFGVLDANDDGQLTRAEWNEQIETDLAFADQNEDGRITLKELANARENLGIGDAIGMVF